jgi:hypothetical protein
MYQPETNPKNFSALFNDIEKGLIKIPQFQRDFVWSKDKSAKLIDSIIKGYPIGTFIIWKTKEILRTVRNIGGIEFPETPKGDFVEYVLDGQQRITSIYASLKGLVIKKYYDDIEKLEDFSQMYIDLEAGMEEDIILTNIEEKELNKVLKLKDLLNSDLRYLVDNYPDYIDKISDYRKQLQSYNFTIVTTRDIPIDVATEIFTRLNTGGKPLTNFEIMVAKTFDTKTNFDLADEYDKLIKTLSKVNYDTISDSTVLQVVSILIKKECKKNTILKLEKNNFIKTWPEAVDAIKTTVDYFRNQYRIKASQILPYNALVVPFAYFFHKHPGKPVGLKQKYLQDFFWRVSLSDRYSSGQENKIAQDIKRIDKILEEKLPTYDYVPRISEENISDDGYFILSRSYIKAILCIYSYFLPRSFSDNSLVTIDNDWLKTASSKNFHHFFPRAFLNKKNEPEFFINHIANITIVDDYLNKREIKTKAPSVYMKKFKRINREITETMKSHLIDSLDRFGVWENNYDKFFNKRIKAISRELKKRIIKQETDYKSDENLDQKILINNKDVDIKKIIARGESNNVEFKSSLRWDYKQNCINKQLLEMVIAKTIAAFMNSSGGILLIGVDDEGGILGLEKDYETVKNKNSDGFKLLLDSIISHYLGKELHQYINVFISDVDGKHVCAVNVLGSDAPVFVKDDDNKEIFVVRASASSLPLDAHDAHEYIKTHW